MAKQSPALAAKRDGKAAIKKLISDFMHALRNKDVKSMLSVYAPDVVCFDVKPPYQVKGAVAWKHIWEASIGYFPPKFNIEIKELKIHAGSDVAVAHYMFRVTGAAKDHGAAQTYIRITTGLKKIQGKWKVVHEHGSVPFNPHTRMANFTLEP